MAQMNRDPRYVMGRTQNETERLIRRAQLHEGLTRRFLQEAGIQRGMRVLDVGSGAGDVAFLIADMVGPAGEVVGVDVNSEILHLARDRARQAGLANVSFLEGDARTTDFSGQFDAIVGRRVLLYMSDPGYALRQLKAHLGPGGIVACQESEITLYRSLVHPDTPLMNQLIDWALEVFQRSGTHSGMGLDLHRAFVEAGLPEPVMNLGAVVGGGETWPGYSDLASDIRSLLPFMEEYGIATAEEVDIETLAERLRRELVAAKRPTMLAPQVTAWGKVT